MAVTEVHISRKIYNEKYVPYLDATQRIQILFGGSSSGKSVFLAQRRARRLLNGGRNYLCVRKVKDTLRGSIFNETVKAIGNMGLIEFFKINKSDLTITCVNGYQAIFKGLDDIEKVKSITPEKGVFTDIDIEEATECCRDELKQLAKRLRGKAGKIKKSLTLAFNPILKSHWIFEDFFKGVWQDDKDVYMDDRLLILHSTYKDNRFLELDDIDELENEKDPYFFQVYTLGKWGVLGNLVFPNYRKMDILNDPIYKTFDIFKNGLDFGFTADPSTLSRSYYDKARKRIYIFKEWLGHGCTNDVIAESIKPIVGDERVVCDSSEPKSIAELDAHGINAEGAIKGKDSIRHGINWLKQQEIIIDYTCQGHINEFDSYTWKKDKNGNAINEPVDKYNHFIDPLRYAYEDESGLTADWDEDYNGEQSVASDSDTEDWYSNQAEDDEEFSGMRTQSSGVNW